MPLVISLNIIKSFYSFRSSQGPGWVSPSVPGELTAVAAVRCAAAAKPGHLTAFNCSYLSADVRKNMLALLRKRKNWFQ